MYRRFGNGEARTEISQMDGGDSTLSVGSSLGSNYVILSDRQYSYVRGNHMAPYIIGGLVLVYVAFVIVKRVKAIKKGQYCSCGCESCPSSCKTKNIK